MNLSISSMSTKIVDNLNFSNVSDALQSEKTGGFSLLTNIFIISTSFIIVAILTIALIILNKCKKIPFQIKWLSNGFISSTIVSELTVFIMSVIYITADVRYTDVIFYVRILLVSSFTNLSWGCSVLIALERLVALSLPLHYASLVRRTRLVALMAAMFALCFVLPALGSILYVATQCNAYFQECEMFNVMQPIRLYFCTSVSVFLIFNVISYVRISKIIYKHTVAIGQQTCTTIDSLLKPTKPDTEVRNKNRLLRVTRTIKTILLVFVCLHLIPIVHTISFDAFPSLRNEFWKRLFQGTSYFASYINSFICSYLYIWKIQECKMNFLRIFLSWIKKYREEAERIRISVYNIVTNEQNARF